MIKETQQDDLLTGIYYFVKSKNVEIDVEFGDENETGTSENESRSDNDHNRVVAGLKQAKINKLQMVKVPLKFGRFGKSEF